MAPQDQAQLTKRSAEVALMPPPQPPVKRQKRPRTVVDEDIYHDAVSHIVARDFFPGLLESKAQEEYISALDSQNADWIRDSGRRLTEVMTPGPNTRRRTGTGTSFLPRTNFAGSETPRSGFGDTPKTVRSTTANADFLPEESHAVDINLSLGAFQAKYTSEDNESFNALLDRQNEKRAEKYTFLYHGNKIPSARQIAHREREQKLLHSGGGSSSLVVANAAGEERRALAREGPSRVLDDRPASVDSFPVREGPRNHLMFEPDGIDDIGKTSAGEAEQHSGAAPKAVSYIATRFPITTAPSEAVPPSPSMSAIDAAVAGRPRPTASEPGYSGAETPRVNGYAFVDAEPAPSELGLPVTDEEADAAEREAAMKLLPAVEAGGPSPFSIQERSKREEVHDRLVQRADAARRQEKGGSRLDQLRNLGVTPVGKTPTPRFSSAPHIAGGGGRAMMTPAAQRLAARIGTPKRDESAFTSQSGRDGKTAWTPIVLSKTRNA